ncbi:hypothetical protein BDP27DRAFT_1445258 [Rhodocollybia butyracea]|uniref:Methyltransferase domain-containing protein n=1 Tax=Rhodocollybia butyracea TaxID=206335 RepID=A0A9P5Q049_9AGAR|nr:hypothetical protein BDP27DRAFT_1445258 [Rhodocollybia butyracea]
MATGTWALLGGSWKAIAPLTPRTEHFILTISLWAGVLTSIQDLRDMKGDAAVGRQTLPLVLGSSRCRWTITFFLTPASLLVLWGGYRVMNDKGSYHDHKTYMIYSYTFCLILAVTALEGLDWGDNVTTIFKLNLLHRIITKAFGDQLALAPITLRTNDRVLESGAGTGIWAQEFSAFHSQNNVLLDIECIDISDKQFPREYPSNIHFSIPLLIVAMNDARWITAIDQLYDVLKPGACIELVEIGVKGYGFGVGPNSKRLESLVLSLYASKGVVTDLEVYLPKLLAKKGFIDIHREDRKVYIRESVDNDGLNRLKQFHDLWMGIKTPVLTSGGFGIVGSDNEFDQLLEGCLKEWKESDKAYNTYYSIVARKPVED